MKVIAFSLWGEDPKYCDGAVANAKLAQELFPDWQCRFYLGRSVPTKTYTQLLEYPNVRVVNMHVNGDWRGMFWRFGPAGEEEVEAFLSRDCDSRLSPREAAAVKEWLDSPRLIHVIRDHPEHSTPILGGLWGAKSGAIPGIKDYMAMWRQENRWQTDQEFLRDIIWPMHKHKVMAHDDWGRFREPGVEVKPFPTQRENQDFVGAIIGPDEERLHPEHHRVLQ